MKRFEVDVHDVMVIVGLAMAGAGFWWIYPPTAFIVIGGILFWAGRRG